MAKTSRSRTSRATEAMLDMAAEQKTPTKYVLRLYVAGFTPRSAAAIENVKATCEEFLKGHYDLEIIDVTKNPTLAKGEQIIAAPTLIKKLPLPLRRLIGDMADQEKVLIGLDLRPRKEAGSE